MNSLSSSALPRGPGIIPVVDAMQGYWCPVSLRHYVISSHDIDYVR